MDIPSPQTTSRYIGRFAPSPSGPLHFGSLVAAVASYLDARHCGGSWLVRMDDIDPPREVAGAADTILRQLEAHQLSWDGDVLYQSGRSEAYQQAIEGLKDQQLTYPCDCSRQAIKTMGGLYNGHCRHRMIPPKGDFALRLWVKEASDVVFDDSIQGDQRHHFKANGNDDFVVQRRDRLYAYQLACAVDDLYQGITHVIRGSDLLDSTPRQLYLMGLLTPNTTLPQYGHIPVAIGADGQKLSKQNLAAAIDPAQASNNIYTALCWLHHTPPDELNRAPAEKLLEWAVENWQRDRIPRLLEIAAPYN